MSRVNPIIEFVRNIPLIVNRKALLTPKYAIMCYPCAEAVYRF